MWRQPDNRVLVEFQIMIQFHRFMQFTENEWKTLTDELELALVLGTPPGPTRSQAIVTDKIGGANLFGIAPG